jgi:hypothetical protein
LILDALFYLLRKMEFKKDTGMKKDI